MYISYHGHVFVSVEWALILPQPLPPITYLNLLKRIQSTPTYTVGFKCTCSIIGPVLYKILSFCCLFNLSKPTSEISSKLFIVNFSDCFLLNLKKFYKNG